MTSTIIPFESLPNTRDLGGMEGAGGKRIVCGKLIRSGRLCSVSSNDIALLSEKTDMIIDLRTNQEVNEPPDIRIPGTEYIHLPVIDEVKPGITREEEADRSFEETTEDLLKHPEYAKEFMKNTYRGLVSSDYSVAQYAKFISYLAAGAEKAILWHCTGGKDRAGFASIIIEKILGVSGEAILEDYLATNQYVKGEMTAVAETVSEKTGRSGAELELAVSYLFGAHTEYLESLTDVIKQRWGSFDSFLETGLGVTPGITEALRNRYLV